MPKSDTAPEPLDNTHLAIAIARELGWRIETVVVKTVMVSEADRPREMHRVPVRDFKQFEVFDPDGQRVARGISEYEIPLFLPEWVDKTDAALALPLVANAVWIIYSDGRVDVRVGAEATLLGTASAKRTARTLCLAWLESRKHEHDL